MPLSGWNTGALVLTLYAYLLRDWANLQLAFALTSLGLVLFWFALPESPRWLLQKAEFDKAETVLRLIARRNGIGREKLDGETEFGLHFEVLKEKIMADIQKEKETEDGEKG